jgi:uncharacterized membrane protein
MRTVADRIRHAVSFEVIGLLLITPLGAWIFHLPLVEMGVVGVGSALIATLWNYVYNLGFDHALRRLTGSTARTVGIRVIHALLFEVGLLAMLMPFIALYLGIGLWQALMMDIAFAGFFLVYAFAFNWVYDRVFPVPPSTWPIKV